MSIKITQELLEQYHLGLCSAAEKAAVEEWLDSPSVQTDFPEDTDFQMMEEQGWTGLADRLDFHKKTRLFVFKPWMKLVAAACFLLLTATAILFYTRQNSGPSSGHELAALNFTELKTGKGEKLNYTLPDGTVVHLNGESSLKYPKHFSDSSRVLEFSGEAYFTVTKDANRPFIVHSAQTTTQVLGTSFNLKAYPGEEETAIVVTEGKVSFSDKAMKQSLIIQPNQCGTYLHGKSLVSTEVYAEKYASWKDGKLVFDNEKLSAVALKLERWFNVEVVIARPELRNDRFSGKFDQPQVSDVLHSLSVAIQFKYKMEKNMIRIY